MSKYFTNVTFWVSLLIILGCAWLLGLSYGFGFNFFYFFEPTEFLKLFIYPFTRSSWLLFYFMFFVIFYFSAIRLTKSIKQVVFKENEIKLFWFLLFISSGIISVLAMGYIKDISERSFFPEISFGVFFGSLFSILVNRYLKEMSYYLTAMCFMIGFFITFSFRAGKVETFRKRNGEGIIVISAIKSDNVIDSAQIKKVFIISSNKYHFLYDTLNKSISILRAEDYRSLEFK